MAFRPANPTAADYAKPFPAFITDRLPAVADVIASADAAREALDKASSKAATARAKLAALGGPEGPAPSAKRASWDKANDDVRASAAGRENAARALARAERARFEAVYDAMDEESFAAQVLPLYAEASRRAKEHLDALRTALTDRAEFADMLGRTIDVEGGNWGLRDALATAAAHVDAGLVDEDTREVEASRRLFAEALDRNILTTDRKLEAARAVEAVLDGPDPVAAVSDVLRRFKLA